MAGETKLTPYKQSLVQKLRCLQEAIATGRTKGVTWVQRSRTRVRGWGRTGFTASYNYAQCRAAFLRQHPAGLKAIAGVALLVVALLALWQVPQWQVADPTLSPKERLELQDKARGTLAQIIGGMVVLFGLYFTGRSAAAAWRTVQINQEGQITERFTRAIEQLGSDKLAVRLGGIYALERIARESATDHWSIMEILTAYVREHAPWKPSQQPQEGEPPKPAADIQAILTRV